jgi:glycosyltransferase involved in cell wall biosynthesis
MVADSSPLVSVHIITYNQEPYAARAIEGALQQQTDFEVEIVVGEDCSTDGTREIVLRYQREHPTRVRVITSGQNVGAFDNSNRVLKACRGRYLAFCDGDDYWTDPHKLQKQVDFLEAHPEYSLCCHDVEVVCDGVPRMGRFTEFTGDTFSFDDAVTGHFISTSTMVCRRELAPTIPLWVKGFRGVDIFMELLLLDQGPGHYIHETMSVKVDNPGGISLIPQQRAEHVSSFLRTYQRMNRHTEGRHRAILRWKIAQLSLVLALENLKVRRFPSFLRYTLESLRYDPIVVWDLVQRRLRALMGVSPKKNPCHP